MFKPTRPIQILPAGAHRKGTLPPSSLNVSRNLSRAPKFLTKVVARSIPNNILKFFSSSAQVYPSTTLKDQLPMSLINFVADDPFASPLLAPETGNHKRI